MSKILFLDIDGVLVTTRSKLAVNRWDQFDVVSCQLIDKLCTYCDAKIVISSTWREQKTRENLEDILRYNDISRVHLHTDWATPVLRDSRQKEINAWLKMHKEVACWAVLDDGVGLNDASPRLVQPDFDDGLQFKDVMKLLVILNGNAEQWFRDADVKYTTSDKKYMLSIKSTLANL